MGVISVKIKLDDGAVLPAYATAGASGVDLRALESTVIARGAVGCVKTGVYIELPKGFEAQIRPRSGLALKHGITVLNTPGTIDSDYRGEICVILANLGTSDFAIEAGDRIAQMVFTAVEHACFSCVSELGATDRAAGGFGSTGVR